jgi:peptidoglycan hydrolase CwlO-like protein
MNWDIDWNTILSSVVIVAVVTGIFKTIITMMTLRNKTLQEQIASLNKENEELTNQIKELQQTISDREATIKDLQESVDSMKVRYHTNQRNSGYSDYISWET